MNNIKKLHQVEVSLKNEIGPGIQRGIVALK